MYWKPRTGAGSTLSSKKVEQDVDRPTNLSNQSAVKLAENPPKKQQQQEAWIMHAARRQATKKNASSVCPRRRVKPKQPLNSHNSSKESRGERTKNAIRRSRPSLNQHDVSEMELGAKFGGPYKYSQIWDYGADKIAEEDEELNEIAAEGQHAFYCLVNGLGGVEEEASSATSSNDAASFDGVADNFGDWPSLPGSHCDTSTASPVSDGILLERTGSWEVVGGGGGCGGSEVREGRAGSWEMMSDLEDEDQGDDWLVIPSHEGGDGERSVPKAKLTLATQQHSTSYLSTAKRLTAPEAEAVVWKYANSRPSSSERTATTVLEAHGDAHADASVNAASLDTSRRSHSRRREPRVRDDYEAQKSLHDHVVRSRKTKQGMEARERRMAAKAKARSSCGR